MFNRNVSMCDHNNALTMCSPKRRCQSCDIVGRCSYILLHIFLPCLDSTLSDLEAHLRCGVVHEVAKGWVHIRAARSLRLALLLRIAISAALRALRLL